MDLNGTRFHDTCSASRTLLQQLQFLHFFRFKFEKGLSTWSRQIWTQCANEFMHSTSSLAKHNNLLMCRNNLRSRWQNLFGSIILQMQTNSIHAHFYIILKFARVPIKRKPIHLAKIRMYFKWYRSLRGWTKDLPIYCTRESTQKFRIWNILSISTIIKYSMACLSWLYNKMLM